MRPRLSRAGPGVHLLVHHYGGVNRTMRAHMETVKLKKSNDCETHEKTR
jgi:hypothetical protein